MRIGDEQPLLLHRGRHCTAHARFAQPEHGWALGADEVDVLTPVDIANPGAMRAIEIERKRLVMTTRSLGSSGRVIGLFLPKRKRLREKLGVHAEAASIGSRIAEVRLMAVPSSW